jgi:hypothetical protein
VLRPKRPWVKSSLPSLRGGSPGSVTPRRGTRRAGAEYIGSTSHTINTHRCGVRIATAELKFFCEDSTHSAANGVGTGDLSKWPKQGKHPTTEQVCGGTLSGYLGSTDNEQDVAHFWYKQPVASEPPAMRITGVVVDCCSKPGSVFPFSTWNPGFNGGCAGPADTP